MGVVLRDLHSLTLADGLELPRYDAFGRSDLRLERSVGVADGDLDFLRKRGRELKEQLAGLCFESSLGPVHGDAHTDNLMVSRDGVVYLIDFENFCLDHPEWDLEVAAHEYDRLGWMTQEQYADFVGAYGRDLREWPGFSTLCAVQEFKMTTWLMQNVAEGEKVAEEFARRMASLRDEGAPRRWLPY